PVEVACGIQQTIGVIDAQGVDASFVDQLEPEPVYGAEDVWVFDANRGQLVDVEEAAIVDLVGRDAPVAQPVSLLRQQLLQTVEAVRLAFHPVEIAARGSYCEAHLFTGVHQSCQPPPDDLGLPAALAGARLP